MSDGGTLVDEAFAFRSRMPALALNKLVTPTEQNEQTGLMLLIKGMFSTFRNTAAHVPALAWNVELEDALDLLTLVSMLHRRIDAAHVTTSAPAHRP